MGPFLYLILLNLISLIKTVNSNITVWTLKKKIQSNRLKDTQIAWEAGCFIFSYGCVIQTLHFILFCFNSLNWGLVLGVRICILKYISYILKFMYWWKFLFHPSSLHCKHWYFLHVVCSCFISKQANTKIFTLFLLYKT